MALAVVRKSDGKRDCRDRHRKFAVGGEMND
jgi:hypothetical protein